MTQFMHFNDSQQDSSVLLVGETAVENFAANATIRGDQGSVAYGQDEKAVNDDLETRLLLIFQDTVLPDGEYQVPFDAMWHSLPYSYEGGRDYSHSGLLLVSTKNFQVSLSHVTSNPLTEGKFLQVQEQVFANITVRFPEVKMSSSPKPLP
jgi:hypothetical protein